MRFKQWFGLAAIAASTLACSAEPAPQLRVVYAGDADTPHAGGYHALLAKHFDVRSIGRNTGVEVVDPWSEPVPLRDQTPS